MSSVTCPNCGTANRPGAKFCQQCRTPLTPAATGPTTPPSVPPTTPVSPPAGTPTASVPPPAGATTMDMPPPGGMTTLDMPVGGMPTAFAPPPVVPPTTPATPSWDQTSIAPPNGQPVEAAPAGKAQCPNCGNWNRIGAKFCSSCRSALLPAEPPPMVPAPPVMEPAPIPVPIAPPVQIPPAQLEMAPSPRRSGFPFVMLLPFLCLLGSLMGGLGAVFAYEIQPTATPTAFVVDVQKTATAIPSVPTPTSNPTFTLTPTPNPEAGMLLAFVSTPIGPDPNKSWTAWPGQFGLRTADNKPLTFRITGSSDIPDGRTNNSRVWVDGPGASFGSTDGEFGQMPTLSDDGRKLTTIWKYKKVVFTQVVELVLNPTTYKYDTYRIGYSANNQDDVDHEVNVRLLLDTMIGENDGVYFSIPGTDEIISKPQQILGSDVSDYYQISVLENPDLTNPGVVARLTLSGYGSTRPSHIEITQWCDSKTEPEWDYLTQFHVKDEPDGLHQCADKSKKLDSAIGIFFEAKKIKPGESADWATAYGLGQVEQPTENKAGVSISFMSIPHEMPLDTQFYVTALIKNPKPGQSVQLTLPPQLQLLEGNAKQDLTQTNVAITQISWKVKAVNVGAAKVTVQLSPDNLNADVSTNVVTPPTPTPTLMPTPCVPSPFNRCFITPSPTPLATSTPKP